ncbi:helix-turn-helix domain-containing protein, partial [Coprococcus eutactus]|uniref:helix-turn-helix domain-containing protein n=1 Tax=Coprococcus eutactus TaxID=33043 RepID=UPI00210C54A3
EKTKRYQAIQELVAEKTGTVKELAAIANVSRKSYYQWLKREVTKHELEDQAILEAIYQIEKRHQHSAGYEKVTK